MNLKEFFVDKNITIPFKLFGFTHLFLMFVVILIALILTKNKLKLNNLSKSTKRTITLVIALILLLNMLTLYISSFIYHNFDFNTMLPLHLCYLSNYFYIYVILFNKEHLYKYTYFLGFLGPIPAIIFFDVPSIFESFNFYLYLISHHFFLLSTILTFYMYPKKIPKTTLLKLFLILNILYFLMIIFNHHFNTNYFFTTQIPPFIINIFPFLKTIPTIIILELLEVFIMYIIYKFWYKQESLLNTKNML